MPIRYFLIHDEKAKLPNRSTAKSAGYDFFAPKTVQIPSIWKGFIKMLFKRGDCIVPTLVDTGVSVRMMPGELLMLANRSSNPLARGLILANGVGIVDADYSENIKFMYYNIFPFTITIKEGDKIGQGIFLAYKKVDKDSATTERTGGFGSTDEPDNTSDTSN